jgi:tetratricopeptide (TPR) repeat protein
MKGDWIGRASVWWSTRPVAARRSIGAPACWPLVVAASVAAQGPAQPPEGTQASAPASSASRSSTDPYDPMMGTDPESVSSILRSAMQLPAAQRRLALEAMQSYTAAHTAALRGDGRRAVSLQRRTVELATRAFGSDHLATALALGELGTYEIVRGELQEAEITLRRALRALRAIRSEPGRDEARLLGNLALVHANKGDWHGSVGLMEQALALERRLLRPDDPELVIGMTNLFWSLASVGRVEDGAPLIEEAESIVRAVRPGPSRQYPGFLHARGGLKELRGDRAGAERDYDEAIDVAKRIYGESCLSAAAGLENLCRVRYTGGDHAGAEAAYREGYTITQRELGEFHLETCDALSGLARSVYAQGRLEEARTLLRTLVARGESRRTSVAGDERARAMAASAYSLNEAAAYLAMAEARLGDTVAALEAAERGRARGMLDLVARADHLDGDLTALSPQAAEGIRAAELTVEQSHVAVVAAEGALAAARRQAAVDPAVLSELAEAVTAARDREADAEVHLLSLLRESYPDGRPLEADAIRAAIRPGELLLEYIWTEAGVMLLVVPPRGEATIEAVVLARDAREAEALRDRLDRAWRRLGRARALRSAPFRDAALESDLVPPRVREQVATVDRIIVVPSGPLRSVPLDALAAATVDGRHAGGHAAPSQHGLMDDRAHLVYAPSATLFVNRRRQYALRAAPLPPATPPAEGPAKMGVHHARRWSAIRATTAHRERTPRTECCWRRSRGAAMARWRA